MVGPATLQENPSPQPNWHELGHVSYMRPRPPSDLQINPKLTPTNMWHIAKIQYELPGETAIAYDEMEEGVMYLGDSRGHFEAMFERIKN